MQTSGSWEYEAGIMLAAGDTVQLTLYGLLGAAVFQGGAGASMTIIRIG